MENPPVLSNGTEEVVLCNKNKNKFLDSMTLDAEEGKEIINLEIEDNSEDEEAIDTLLKGLEYCNFAIVQATRYINNKKKKIKHKNYKIKDYLIEYNSYKEKTHPEDIDLLRSKDYDQFNNFEETLYTTSRMVFDEIKRDEEHGQYAIKILNLTAYLNSNDIPIEFFQCGSESEYEKLSDALKLLGKFLMVAKGNCMIEMRQFGQDTIRLELQRQGKTKNTFDMIFELLEKCGDYDEIKTNSSEMRRKFLPHLESLLAHIDEFRTKNQSEENIGQIYLNKLLNWMSKSYNLIGNILKEKDTLERLLKIKQNLYGTYYFEVGFVYCRLGLCLSNTEDEYETKEMIKKGLYILEKFIFGKTISTIGIILTNDYNTDHESYSVLKGINEAFFVRNNAYNLINKRKKQEILHEKLISIGSNIFGLDSNSNEHYLINYNTYTHLQDPIRDREYLLEILKVYRKKFEPDHIEIGHTLFNLSNVYEKLENFKKQEELLKQALEIYEKHYGQDHIKLSELLLNLSNIYDLFRDQTKQIEALERVLNIYEIYYGIGHVKVADILYQLSFAYKNNITKQKGLLKRALIIYEKNYEPDHIKIGDVLNFLSIIYKDLKNSIKQFETSKRVLTIYEKHYGIDHLEVSYILLDLSEFYQTNRKEQIECLERAINIIEKNHGENNWVLGKIIFNLSNVYGILNNLVKQKELLQRSLKIYEKYFYVNDEEFKKVREKFKVLNLEPAPAD